MPKEAVDSAFPAETRQLGELVKEALIDYEALSRPIVACQLERCFGTCCHDGVYLTNEEASSVRSVVEDFRQEIEEDLEAELPSQVVVYGRFRDVASGPKTATRIEPMRQRAEDYPKHFAETQCVFLMKDAKCALQALSIRQNRDPWFYKPLTCWIHPLSFSRRKRGIYLTLPNLEEDSHNYLDYPGFGSQTHCGRICENNNQAKPAYQVLAAELNRLGALANRDLIEEIEDHLG